jgi:hypothetical protein
MASPVQVAGAAEPTPVSGDVDSARLFLNRGLEEQDDRDWPSSSLLFPSRYASTPLHEMRAGDSSANIRGKLTRSSAPPKLLLLPSVLIPTLLSILLFCANRTHWHTTGPLLGFTLTNRATVQIVVQILAHCLGALQTHVFCTLIAFGIRIHLGKKYISLKYLKFSSAVVATRFDLTLPKFLLLQLVLFNLLNILPSALWAGSITPIVLTSGNSSGSTAIGSFPPGWNASSANASLCLTNQSSLGTFTNCPGWYIPDRFVSVAATASMPSGAIGNRTKYDNTQFLYIGRSYGVGSSVGLVSPWTEQSLSFVQNIQYTEYGYNSSVTCGYNSSSSLNRTLLQPGSVQGGIPAIYQAQGRLPNTELPEYAYNVATLITEENNDDAIVGFLTDCGMGRYLYAFTAGQNYAVLDKIQCEVSYTPCEFQVVVSQPDKSITVNPVRCGASVPDVDPTGALRCQMVVQPAGISWVTSVIPVSFIGQAFLTNIANVNISLNARQTPSNMVNASEVVLQAMAASLTAVTDEAFSAFASAQLIVANNATSRPINLTAQVLAFGQAGAIEAVLAVSVFILLIAIEEAIRTQFWNELPIFNFMDIKSCILASALGGRSIRESMVENLSSDVWLGRAEDPRLDNVKVMLRSSDAGVSIEANHTSMSQWKIDQ